MAAMTHRIIVAVWLTAALTAATAAHAEAPKCATTQADMNRCASATFADEDAELNRRYRQALKDARDDEARSLLRTAQRAWVAFRDAECRRQGDSGRGGSIRPLLEAGCATRMTRQRLLEFTVGPEEPPPGLENGIALARLLDRAPADLRTGIYWLPESIQEADFNDDGVFDLSAVGLRPADAKGEGGSVHVLFLPGGSDRLLRASIAIGGSGLCAPPQSVRLDYPESGDAPLIVIEDGACKPFRLGLTGGSAPALLLRH